MSGRLRKYCSSFRCKSNVWFLATTWIAGLFIGITFSHFSRSSHVSLMLAAAQSSVSIVGLLVSNLIPVVITATAVVYSIPLVIGILFFLRAFLLGVCYVGILSAFGSGGWLICILLLFSFGWVNGGMIWLSLADLPEDSSVLYSRIAVVITFILVISMVDYIYIPSFLIQILESV